MKRRKRNLKTGAYGRFCRMATFAGEKIVEMCLNFTSGYPKNIKDGYEQKGDESFYSRRRPKDSEMDINKTIAEQFNLLRIVDNERYPAFFRKNGKKYRLKIYEDQNEE